MTSAHAAQTHIHPPAQASHTGDEATNAVIEQLVLDSRSGNQLAWESLVRHLSPLVWSVARGCGLERDDAIDVAQTTWLQFARHITKLDEPRKAPGWLATTARRESARMAASRRRETAVEPEQFVGLSSGLTVETDIEADSERKMIWDTVDRLPDNCRPLIRMFLAEPPPAYEIVAQALNLSVNAVGPKRTRCLAHLRVALRAKLDSSEVN